MKTASPQIRSAPGESELVQRHRRGDRAAFDEIVARHRQVVYLTARRIVGSHEDADEVAQLAFVRAWRSLGRFRGESSLRTWLVRIALNVAKSMRAGARPLEPVDEDAQIADDAPGSDETIELEQLRGRVRQAVSTLPPRQREVVMLKVFGEMTYREVGEIMELTEGAVKAHLNQAVSNLRRRMSVEDGRSIA